MEYLVDHRNHDRTTFPLGHLTLLQWLRIVTKRDPTGLEVHESVLVDLGVQHPVGQLAVLFEFELGGQESTMFNLLLQHGLFFRVCPGYEFALGVQVVTGTVGQQRGLLQEGQTGLLTIQLPQELAFVV